MFNISLYLEKFKTLGLGDIAAKEAIIAAVEKCIGITLERKDIEYKNGHFRIKADPIVKSEIQIKKTSILECLEKELGGKVKDIS